MCLFDILGSYLILKLKLHNVYVYVVLQVFVNPSVASLPQHAHLFGGHGCYKDAFDSRDGGQACEGEDALPSALSSLLDCRKPSNISSSSDDIEYVKTLWTCKRNQGHRKLRMWSWKPTTAYK